MGGTNDSRLVMTGRPANCTRCGGTLNYCGLGQYRCEDCGNIEMDDYGKVRAYLEEHPGAMQHDVAVATGVPAGRIRQLLLEDRIEIAATSGLFLHCEMCGVPIRSGVRCKECEKKFQTQLEHEKKANRASAFMSGHSAMPEKQSGEMRFLKK